MDRMTLFLFIILFMVFSFSLVSVKYQTILYFRLSSRTQKILSAVHGIIVTTNIFLFFSLSLLDANSISLSFWVRILGALFFLLGTFLLLWAALLLKRALVHPQPADQLIKSRPFRWVRHPMYLGGITGAFGFSLASSSLLAIIYSFLQVVVLYALAVMEELDLGNRFGAQYEIYSRETPRLFPSLWVVWRKRKRMTNV